MPMYEVITEESKTKRYYVQAKSEEEARDTYLIQGMTSALYEKEIDRSIIDVSELVNKNGEPYD
ncbi:MAG TPA: hypothetical protein DCM40_34345 [Maribacter sp.]|jgi:hypothetical protein|nr:hypothetical protein [Maribacter sp.]|tara:strand:+ start:1020 stop:1211 length:192 start_codon:yes stop_codon:yes gene_type:complete